MRPPLQDDDEDVDLSDGFWEEFFLLRPEHAALKRTLRDVAPDDMLHLQAHTQQLFLRAILRVRQASAPADENALDVCARSTHCSVFAGSLARP